MKLEYCELEYINRILAFFTEPGTLCPSLFSAALPKDILAFSFVILAHPIPRQSTGILPLLILEAR